MPPTAYLGMLIPILALSIPVAAIVLNGLYKIQKARLEETRLRTQGGAAPEMQAQLDDLRDEMQQVRTELAEVQERLDFAERLLANPPARTAPQKD